MLADGAEVETAREDEVDELVIIESTKTRPLVDDVAVLIFPETMEAE